MADELRAHTRVQVRNSIGQFAAELEGARQRTVERAGRVGWEVARAHAPFKSGRLHDSIWMKVGNGTATFGTGVSYGMAQEGGARPHPITGKPRLKFWWEKQGVMFVGPKVRHPGNPGVHFLAAGYHAATNTIMDIARQEYPN